MKTQIATIQKHLGVKADGIIGPITLEALYQELGITPRPIWPTQSDVRSGKSLYGSAGDETKLVSISPAYPLFYEGKSISSIRVHRGIALHVQQVLREVLEYYGRDEIERLGLDQYGGSYAYRSTTNGSKLSMHAWGIALDWAPASNGYSTKAPRASLSHPDCTKWWEIWEAHGAISLGRECDYDWMHVQFATL
ncbi:MAG: M15 family metallopeptidase [Akkermansia sp.]